MATYLMLLRFSQQGIQKIKDGPRRVDAAKKLCRDLGGEVKQFYALMGQYDAALILEAPADEAATKIGLALSSLGNVRSETLRAFTETEYRQIIAGLP
jgi:uncharacterized protein with GYD domain